MIKRSLVSCAAILVLILACAGFAEGTGETTMDYRTEEIWCQNGADSIYGIAYIPDTDTKVPLVIFFFFLGNNHESMFLISAAEALRERKTEAAAQAMQCPF